MPKDSWAEVDAYLVATLVGEDEPLSLARTAGDGTSMPGAEVAPNQGKLLMLLAQMVGATRVLEFGTLAGYSTIWLARAVGPHGTVTSLERDATNAQIARANLDRADLGERVDIIVGPAAVSVLELTAQGVPPYDFVFIDADKPSNSAYLRATMDLTNVGSVIVIDNVVRDGAVVNAASTDDRVRGVRSVLADIAADSRLDATALQTVGSKGWDGFTIIRRIA